MCLLVMHHNPDAPLPLVVAANRDEFYQRPAEPVQVLADGPRVLGGLDVPSGGTWLAANAHGVVVGVTNWPLPAGPDQRRTSRGQLILDLASASSATAAAERLAAVDGARYNPAFFLLADVTALYYASISPTAAVEVNKYPGRGWIVLENAPLSGMATAKTRRIHTLLRDIAPPTSAAELPALTPLLADHQVPDQEAAKGRLPPLLAACVHTEIFGTRSSSLIALDPAGGLTWLATEGPPCTSPFQDYSQLM